MKPINFKNGIIAGLLILILALLLFKCNGKSTNEEVNPVVYQDTIFLSQWRKERNEKQQLMKVYEHKMTDLQNENKQLCKITKQSKQQLFVYRNKADSIEHLLNSSLENLSLRDSCVNDTIIPLVYELNTTHANENKQCDTTISLLEQTICSKDSILYLQKQIETQLRNFNEEQTLQTDYLSHQLTIHYKEQKKLNRQSKLQKGGILILSGISTSLLLLQLTK